MVLLLMYVIKQIFDQWGVDGWELVVVLFGFIGEQYVVYLKCLKQEVLGLMSVKV